MNFCITFKTCEGVSNGAGSTSASAFHQVTMVDSDSFNKTHFGYYLFPMTWNFPSLSSQKQCCFYLILLYSDFDLGPTESHLKCLSLDTPKIGSSLIIRSSLFRSHLCHFCVRKGYRLISYLHLAPVEFSSFLCPNPFNSFAVIVDIFISGVNSSI